MESSDEPRASAPVVSSTNRQRSISIMEDEELADHAPMQSAGGRGRDAFASVLPPDHSASNDHSSSSANASVTVAPSTAAEKRQDEVPSLNPTPDRASLLCSPAYHAAAPGAVGANPSGSPNGHTLSSPSGPGNPPASWRRSLSPTASVGTAPGVLVRNNSNGGGTAAAAATNASVSVAASAAAAVGASTSRQQRRSSLMHRRPSSSAFGSHGATRGGGGGGGGASPVPTNVNAGNVYTLQLTEDDGGVEMGAARPLLLEALRLRNVYKGSDKGQLEVGGGGNASGPGSPLTNGLTALQQVDGVFYWTDERTPIVSWGQFMSDVMEVATCVQHPSCLSLAAYRLQVLEEKFHLHRLYNADVEENGDRFRRGGGLYANSWRVDNCVGAWTVMNAHWLVEYIQQTVDAHGGDLVDSADVNTMVGGSGTGGGSSPSGNGPGVAPGGDPQTLERVCELLDFPDPYLLTVEGLGLQPSVNRALPYYDALDPALNGSGRNSAALLRLFLSIRSSSPQKGDYLAGAVLPSLTRNELRTSCPQATEMALEITGVLSQEWEQTATWVRTHELDSYRTNQFQILFPFTKWCDGGGGRGPYTARTAAAAGGGGGGGGPHDSADDGPNGAPGDGMEIQGLFKLSGIGNAGLGHDAVPLDASPEDVLTYENYQQLLDHLFLPLFMATLVPEDPKFVDLASLLQHTGAIVLSGDETAKTRGGLGGGGGGGRGASGSSHREAARGRREGDGGSHACSSSDGTDHVDANAGRRRPADVPFTEPVPLTYMCYHIWANLSSLNALRQRRGLNVLQLRVVASNAMIPNTSSPYDASLLLLSYLIADVVVDAVALEKQPALQYLYGLSQVGVTMCPMARGGLGITNLSEHPVARLLWRGLQVSLCTISPLYYHSSPEPLLEEYTAAAKCNRLSPTDISELSLHSVCMSTFEDEVKASWVGAAFLREGWRGNVAELTSVPTARLQLRHDSWTVERTLLCGPTLSASPFSAPRLGVTAAAAATAAAAGSGDAMEFTSGGPSRQSKQGSTTNLRGRDAPVPAAAVVGTTTATARYGSSTATPLRRTASAARLGGPPGSATTTGAVQQASPYTVLDPATNFPRLFLMGPYDRDIANAHIAQSLHRAMDLRHQYSALPLPQPPTLPPSEAAIEVVASGMDGNEEEVRNSWLAALIHDPQAVLPHPTQSMSWAFKKASPAAATAASTTTAPVVVAGAAGRPYLHFDEDEWKYKTVEGIIVPHEVHQIPRLPQDMFHYEDFCRHVQEIRLLIDHIRVREFALRRLQLLEHRFNLHAAVNHSLELGSTAERASQNRDFYQSTKVDNNIRMETGMTARQLLAFIVDKATHNGDDIVSHPKGKEPQTLRQLLSELHISPGSLTVDDLNIQAGATSSDGGAPHNPFSAEGSQDELLTLLLKTDNQMNGRYFAELTKRTFEELSRDQHTFTESRLPVYGASAGEWGLLSHWFDTHGMSSSHNQWVVQVPRIYSSLRKAGRVASFAEYLEHIFEPLWRISLHPNSDPRLFHFVNHIAAFDCVEDERQPDMPLHRATRAPHEWTSEEEPPYNYYLYHLYANLRSLNRFRQRRRFSVFAFRPSCGEAGSVDHLIGGFLLAQNINYGVRLADSMPLQYLYYLAQIGVTLSPLSNNTKLELNYLNNPFPELFRRGLRVSLGTDSPLLYHHTQEPLLEEYSIASKIWKLSPNDLSEVARNSVLLSNFSVSFKEEKLGPLYFLSSSAGNDVTRTHLSNVRVAYRFEAYHTEVGFLEYISGQHFHKALLTLATEAQCKQLCGVAAVVVDKGATEGMADGEGDAKAKNLTELPARQGEKEGERSPTSHSPPPVRGNAILIDPTPKEADVKQLEQQRARMQRQLREVTGAVTDLQKQNRMLTAKLGEEKERDNQAAQLRRHRVGDKLRELQALLDQKQVQPNGTPVSLLSSHGEPTSATMRRGGHAAQRGGRSSDTGPAAADAASESSRSASSHPFGPSPTSFGNESSQFPTDASAAAAASLTPLTRGGDGGGRGRGRAGNTNVAASAEGGLSSVAAAVATAEQNAASYAASAPPAPALSSRDVFITVRSRKAVQQEATIAQTRQLLAHSESLWRSPSSGSAQKAEGMLPPLDVAPPLQRTRWSPPPSAQD
ncbi:putative Adenosine monophosphate deaminase [Leptomonas pyrrhocoris]|uniref:Putative Adenosine monophosphate deaminase n=1 Tax=Leptomonas pyrrhocoris TaxID=157538 RepID=A0A0M9FT84_LEPPY|nr:putative Adenosine monophosphate deaminase [Leptomonas pyrrhocoris]XP_015653909.1 putative Adenosine monophosphate deaminase [Leptomonas pyrrhocoris]KPA75469.1 putative Adenosine monophosphate deaminase [Leptomonas pyrrhocoris]KPA75470.1 putative Adenosine monophosphate deaminase [Leptomonas pyrrhocoris]|eukprot:XP_015653908.1 putative Adenosine monophosphate deaminase [Leptomonas pyrrhocoris]